MRAEFEIMHLFHHKEVFELENGQQLPELNIAYHVYGKLNNDKTNVVWICHALTASSDAAAWWNTLAGPGLAIDPEKYFIICANIIGSCYGSTGPLATDPSTGQPYYSSFPQVTVRDMVRAFILLKEHLGIKKIFLLTGGSMGGYQALEWCVMEKDLVENLCVLTTSAAESAWGIAIHSTQRLAIEADPTWRDHSPIAGQKGLKAARGIGLLTYRNYSVMVKQQSDEDTQKLDNYKASSYINYQGNKLVNRFNAYSYWLLTKSMDSHHLARGRGGKLEEVLKLIKQKTLIIGISSDILCPVEEQKFLHRHIPNSKLVIIDSDYGHDGFIVEGKRIGEEMGWVLGA